jgi:hypothetical protein
LALCIAGAEKPLIDRGLPSSPQDTIEIKKRGIDETYQTSVGFYDLAIAAASMKAAAEAWGSQTDVFRKGFAKETHYPAIVAATMARPGTRFEASSRVKRVLQRTC